MKKWIFGFMALLILSCSNPHDNCSSNIMPMSNFDEGVSAPPTLFINREANEHHQAMRELAHNWPRLEEMVRNNEPVEEIYAEMLGSHFVTWLDLHSRTQRAFANVQLDKNAKALCKMMNEWASQEELLNYMDENKCRTPFNEVLVSSYIAFNEEDNPIEIPLNGIAWDGVAVMDALALGLAGPYGAVACSGGCIVGYGIREIIRYYN